MIESPGRMEDARMRRSGKEMIPDARGRTGCATSKYAVAYGFGGSLLRKLANVSITVASPVEGLGSKNARQTKASCRRIVMSTKAAVRVDRPGTPLFGGVSPKLSDRSRMTRARNARSLSLKFS